MKVLFFGHRRPVNVPDGTVIIAGQVPLRVSGEWLVPCIYTGQASRVAPPPNFAPQGENDPSDSIPHTPPGPPLRTPTARP